MAKRKVSGKGKAKAKARKASAHVTARRVAKATRKAEKRAAKGKGKGTITVTRPDTDSGLDPAEEKHALNVLNALDADEQQFAEDVELGSDSDGDGDLLSTDDE